MKRRKGFTLIELLVVIVILAIIALISIPLVLKYIQTSRDNARLRSAENYLDAVEKAVVNQNMQGKKFNPYVCNVKDEKLYCDGTLLDVSIKGVKPDNGSVITFNNGKIDRVKLLYGDKIIVDNEKDILVYSEDIEILPAGLYDDDNSLLASWDELVNQYGLNLEVNYTLSNYQTSGSMTAVLNNNLNLNAGTKIVIKDGIKSIGNSFFRDCTNLKNIILPETLTSIGLSSFFKNVQLESINIPNTVTSIDMGAFHGCEKLKEVNIPEGIINIETSTFSSCYSLNKITLPNTLIKIGYAAFGHTNIKSLKIPRSVTDIDTRAFMYCSNIEEIVVDKDNSKYDSRENSNAIIETATNKLVLGSRTTIIP